MTKPKRTAKVEPLTIPPVAGPVPTSLVVALVSEDICPRCLTDLDDGCRCARCGFDPG